MKKRGRGRPKATDSDPARARAGLDGGGDPAGLITSEQVSAYLADAVEKPGSRKAWAIAVATLIDELSSPTITATKLKRVDGKPRRREPDRLTEEELLRAHDEGITFVARLRAVLERLEEVARKRKGPKREEALYKFLAKQELPASRAAIYRGRARTRAQVAARKKWLKTTGP